MVELAISAAISAAISVGISFIASAIAGTEKLGDVTGQRLESLQVQTSTYGSFIRVVYGKTRLAGNIIWSQAIEEEEIRTTQSSGGKGAAPKVEQTAVNYNYQVDMAIGLCEGEIDSVLRIWADGVPLDLTLGTYRIYKGSETQNPDSYIESIEGVGSTPAYRGLAYVVVENFPLAQYGNRIPNFTFEIQRSIKNANTVEDKIKEVVLIPGSGEFVYDTIVQTKSTGALDDNGDLQTTGAAEPVNSHNFDGGANTITALNDLLRDVPNVETIAVVVNWFTDTTEADDCTFVPKVEYAADGAVTTPNEWAVAGLTRDTATVINFFPDNTPSYGGTPSDQSLVRLVRYINETLGLNVMLYPMPLVDIVTPGNEKPWRGRITTAQTTGADTRINNMFTKTDGYNEFIMHYVELDIAEGRLMDYVDSVLIGSEMIGVTQIEWPLVSTEYPAVDNFATLAGTVKTALTAQGNGAVDVGYAADWSEYHSVDGFFNMDSLWANANIDLLGIDYYMPITPILPQSLITKAAITAGFESEEGWEYFYTDSQAKTGKTFYSPSDGTSPFAWKNIENFWKTTHAHWSANLGSLSYNDMTVWSKIAATTTGNTVNDARGELLADTLAETVAASSHFIQSPIETFDNTVNHRMVMEVKPNGRTDVFMYQYDFSATSNNIFAHFSLSGAGSVVSTGVGGNGVLQSATIEAIGNGYYRIILQGHTNNVDNTSVRFRMFLAQGTTLNYTGDGTSGVYIGAFSYHETDVNSAWTAKLKKVWVTEYGYPSVDAAANQPNVFYDPKSVESFFPIGSDGHVDFTAQRVALDAFVDYWDAITLEAGNSDLVSRKFLWTWDARPYPFWPYLETVWADGLLWEPGHWVQGKLGVANLGAVVADLLDRVGFSSSEYDVSELTDIVLGFSLSAKKTVRAHIELLQTAYQFDAVESGGILKFVTRRGKTSSLTVLESELVIENTSNPFQSIRTQQVELPTYIDVSYIDVDRDYQVGTQLAQRQTVTSENNISLLLEIVFGRQEAQKIADTNLYNSWVQRVGYKFTLPPKYARVEPTDVITVDVDSITYEMRVLSTKLATGGVQEINAIAHDITAYEFSQPPKDDLTSTVAKKQTFATTDLEFLDTPALPNDTGPQGYLRIGGVGIEGDKWDGAIVYTSADGGEAGGNTFGLLTAIGASATTGTVMNLVADGPTHIWDTVSTIDVLLKAGTLSSVTELAVYNGANIALVGSEIIQFKTATLTAANQYTLSDLLRARRGTEHHTASHAIAERFVLIDDALAKINTPVDLRGQIRHYKPVSIGRTLANTTEETFTYTGESLRPWSVVDVSGVLDENNDWNFAWKRRTRYGGEWLDGIDAPLNEETELYEVDIMDGATVIHTYECTTENCPYTLVEASTVDCLRNPIEINIYQMSALVGRGHVTNATITGDGYIDFDYFENDDYI